MPITYDISKGFRGKKPTDCIMKEFEKEFKKAEKKEFKKAKNKAWKELKKKWGCLYKIDKEKHFAIQNP